MVKQDQVQVLLALLAHCCEGGEDLEHDPEAARVASSGKGRLDPELNMSDCQGGILREG